MYRKQYMDWQINLPLTTHSFSPCKEEPKAAAAAVTGTAVAAGGVAAASPSGEDPAAKGKGKGKAKMKAKAKPKVRSLLITFRWVFGICLGIWWSTLQIFWPTVPWMKWKKTSGVKAQGPCCWRRKLQLRGWRLSASQIRVPFCDT